MAELQVSEIKDMIEVDSLGYLSLNGTIESTSQSSSNFCTACFSGDYPLKIKDNHD